MASSNTDREKEEGELTDDDEGFVTVVRKKQSSHATSNGYNNKYRKGGHYNGYNNSSSSYNGGDESGKEFKTNKTRRNFRYGDRRKGDQRGGRRYQEDRDRDKATEGDGKVAQAKQPPQSSSNTVLSTSSQPSSSSSSGPSNQSSAASTVGSVSSSLNPSGGAAGQPTDNKVITTQPPIPEVPIRRAFAEVTSSNLPSHQQSQSGGTVVVKNNTNSLNTSSGGATATSTGTTPQPTTAPAPPPSPPVATNVAVVVDSVVVQPKLQEVPTPTIRRAFSEVTKISIKTTGINIGGGGGGGGSSSISTRATRGVQTLLEDWPSLQETASSPSGTTPSSTGPGSPSIIAQKKPVISTIATVTEKLGKMELKDSKKESVINTNGATKPLTTAAAAPTNGSSSGEGTTLQKLPEDKWPSIKDAVSSSNGSDHVQPQATRSSSSLAAQRNNTAEKEDGEITDSDEEEVTTTVNKVAKGKTSNNGFELPLTPSSDDRNHKMSENGSLCSSSETTGEHELDMDASNGSGGSGKKGKKNKQKWVPLQLPETPSTKSVRRKERNSAEKDVDKENNQSANHREKTSKGKMQTSNNKDVAMESSMKDTEGAKSNNNQSNAHVYVPRGRGRSNGGIRGRNDKRSGRAAYQSNWVNYNGGGLLMEATSPDQKGDAYADYPADYTTLPPMYPVTEFIMPYLFTPVFTPQPSGTLVDETQIGTSAYVPVDEAVLSDMIRKQIEYYFSEENLQKDFYLRRKMNKEGFLPVTFIATFPRIKTMTQDFNVLIQAIQSSPELEMNKDLTCVRRIQEPNKWPIADEVSLVKAKSMRPKPPTLYLHYTTPQNVLTYPANGYIALSPPLTADSTLNNNSTPFLTPMNPSIADKLNPNVPEFVPKSKLMETKS